jgi:hypothetical protein
MDMTSRTNTSLISLLRPELNASLRLLPSGDAIVTWEVVVLRYDLSFIFIPYRTRG